MAVDKNDKSTKPVETLKEVSEIKHDNIKTTLLKKDEEKKSVNPSADNVNKDTKKLGSLMGRFEKQTEPAKLKPWQKSSIKRDINTKLNVEKVSDQQKVEQPSSPTKKLKSAEVDFGKVEDNQKDSKKSTLGLLTGKFDKAKSETVEIKIDKPDLSKDEKAEIETIDATKVWNLKPLDVQKAKDNRNDLKPISPKASGSPRSPGGGSISSIMDRFQQKSDVKVQLKGAKPKAVHATQETVEIPLVKALSKDSPVIQTSTAIGGTSKPPSTPTTNVHTQSMATGGMSNTEATASGGPVNVELHMQGKKGGSAKIVDTAKGPVGIKLKIGSGGVSVMESNREIKFSSSGSVVLSSSGATVLTSGGTPLQPGSPGITIKFGGKTPPVVKSNAPWKYRL
ncbi:unnamed protein product [Owenia fusiformis]|uniref:Uncharacterized protein n=1 Tax=Owenia fusiformis TaxID=6347 RepID=A0A8S4P5Q3_OWEFU|nr:unnamed protein product [Owenia fusiformis]